MANSSAAAGVETSCGFRFLVALSKVTAPRLCLMFCDSSLLWSAILNKSCRKYVHYKVIKNTNYAKLSKPQSQTSRIVCNCSQLEAFLDAWEFSLTKVTKRHTPREVVFPPRGSSESAIPCRGKSHRKTQQIAIITPRDVPIVRGAQLELAGTVSRVVPLSVDSDMACSN